MDWKKQGYLSKAHAIGERAVLLEVIVVSIILLIWLTLDAIVEFF